MSSPGAPADQSSLVYNVHALRAIAALAVVYFHLSSTAGLNLRASFGTFAIAIACSLALGSLLYWALDKPIVKYLRKATRGLRKPRDERPAMRPASLGQERLPP